MAAEGGAPSTGAPSSTSTNPRSSDPAWAHCTVVDMAARKVQCKYCNRILHGGVYRFKQHLAGIKGEVLACTNVSSEVRIQFRQYMNEKKASKTSAKQRREDLREELSAPPRRSVDEIRLASGRQTIDLDDEDFDAGQLRHAMKESRRSNVDEDYLRRHGRFMGQGSGSGQGSTSMSQCSGSVGEVPIDIPREGDPRVGPLDPYLTKKKDKQPSISAAFKNLKVCKEKIGRATSRWFFFNSIPANAAKGPFYESMIETIGEVGKGVDGPTPHEIYNKYLDLEVDDIKSYIKIFERIWDEYGCTLMMDGWTGITRRSMINFLIYSKSGTVFWKSVDASGKVKNAEYLFGLMDQMVEEIGEKRIVQVVTDNAAAYKLAGKMLMLKREQLWWVPCSAHCIDLMLEDICEDQMVKVVVNGARYITTFIYNHNNVLDIMRKHTQGRELLRPGATRFASQYIALDSINGQRANLIRMVASEDWEDYMARQATQKIALKGKQVVDLIQSKLYWKRVQGVLNVVEPLVRVLRAVDGERRSDMGYLYEAMDRAKELIKMNNKTSWAKWWEIIDKRWENTLHHDLHAAGHFFNPQYMYRTDGRSETYDNSSEVLMGAKEVIKRMLDDDDRAIIACNQMHDYRLQQYHFGTRMAQRATQILSPEDFAASTHLNFQSMHNQLEADLHEGEDRHKTKKQVMEEIIAKSKFYKANRAMEKEEDEHLLEQLDKNFTSLLQSTVFLSLGQKKGLSDPADKASMQEQPDAYDKLVRVLPTDKRARPADRKKTAEEIAEEERERLELLEEERRKRMHSTDESDEEEEDNDGGDEYFRKSLSKKSKHVSGDDLGDSLYINEELAEKTGQVGQVDDVLGNRSGGSAKDADSKSSEDSEDDDDRGNDDENVDDDEGDTDDSLEDDPQSVPVAGDWEQSEDDDVSTDEEEATRNSEAENKKGSDANYNKKQEINYLSNTRKDVCGKSVPFKKDPLPFVIEAPQNLVELCSLVDNRPNEEVVEAINRIRVCNAISLSAENRRKMQVFYGVLLQYFAILATRNPLNVQLINLLVKPLVEMSVDTPYFAAICARERLLHIRNQFCVDIKNPEKSNWPSLKTLLLLRLWSLTFPNSDFRHVVMTPATLLMCEYLMRCPIITGQDTAIGSFLCSKLLSVSKQSLKFYPEAIRFLQLLLMSAAGRPRSQQLNALSFMDVHPVKSWLLLNNQPSDIHPIDFFSIMSMPVGSPFFVSDNFRASVLVAVVETLQGFLNIYERLSSFPEIFLPVSSLLHEVIKLDTTPEMLRTKMASLAEHIEKKVDEFQMLRQPLQMRKQKPAPIKLLNPKFEENFVKGVDYDPDHERVERKKLKSLLKKEAKGAVRELRKDNYFLHEVKEKDRLLLEEERAEMYGKARAFLQEQENAYKSGQLGKGRKRRR